MFKIQRSADEKSVIFTLSGRIKAEQLAELEKLLECEAGDHSLVLDLKEVKLVHRHAVSFWPVAKRKGSTSRIARHTSANGLRKKQHKVKKVKVAELVAGRCLVRQAREFLVKEVRDATPCEANNVRRP